MELETYTEQITVQDTDVDYRGLMKPSALLRYAEQLATANSCQKGFDAEYFCRLHLAYLLGKQALRFDRVPRKDEKLLFTSIPERSRRAANKRATLVQDGAGETVALVDARWILVDTQEGRILRRPPEQLDTAWNLEVPYELPQTVGKPTELKTAGVWKASYSLCDVNGHINNACYLDIACDALPLEVIQAGPLRSVSVKYHREVLMGQSMEVLYGPGEQGGWYVAGRRDGQLAFELICRQ